MNPNAIVLTPEQFATLKAEIIKEVRKEQQESTTTTSRYALTTEIRKLTHPLFGSDYQVQNAISAIARKTFNIRHQTFFYGEALEQATAMIKEIIAVIEKYHVEVYHCKEVDSND